MRDRAFRRHQKFRARAHAARIATKIWGYNREDSVTKYMMKNADNLKTCQHDQCCNVRRDGWVSDGRTLPEILSEISLTEAKKEL